MFVCLKRREETAFSAMAITPIISGNLKSTLLLVLLVLIFPKLGFFFCNITAGTSSDFYGLSSPFFSAPAAIAESNSVSFAPLAEMGANPLYCDEEEDLKSSSCS